MNTDKLFSRLWSHARRGALIKEAKTEPGRDEWLSDKMIVAGVEDGGWTRTLRWKGFYASQTGNNSVTIHKGTYTDMYDVFCSLETDNNELSEQDIQWAEQNRCGDCGVREGELHHRGCDMERCPFCGGQLITCNCALNKLGLFAPDKYPEVFVNGLSDEQERRWEEILEEKGRVPHIEYPNICSKCGQTWPEFFKVSDEEWKYYIAPRMRDTIVCKPCYDYIKRVIDHAKMKG